MHRLKSIEAPGWALRILSLFSLDTAAPPKSIYSVVIISGLLGALYGIFVTPFWSEAVDFGQVWAGFIDYSRSSWGMAVYSAPSLQITLPALLLRAGVDTWHLSLAVSAFFCAVSFSAMAAIAFVFTRHITLSVITSFMMLTYAFGNPFGYPTEYPISYFQFGQTGQYLCLLAVSLAACGRLRTAGIVGGLLAGIHPTWCLFLFIGIAGSAFWLPRACFKNLLGSFALSVLLSLAVLYGSAASLPEYKGYTPPAIPAPKLHAPAAATPAVPAPPASIRSAFSGHNILFSDSKHPTKIAIAFFMPLVLWIALAASYFKTAGPSSWRSHAGPNTARSFFYITGLPVLIAVVFKVYEEVDPQYALFSLIDSRLPVIILRAIINRWFNIISLTMPALLIGILVLLARDRKSWLALAGLFSMVWWSHASWYIVRPLNAMTPNALKLTFPQHCTFVVFVLLGFWLIKLEKKWIRLSHEKTRQILFVGLLGSYVLYQLYLTLYSVMAEKRYTGSDAADAVVAAARADSGQLILAGGIVGAQGRFNPQLRTARAIILPQPLAVYDAERHALIHVYCDQDVAKGTLYNFYATIPACFEKRPKREWQVIGRELAATGIMTPETVKLSIPVTASSGGLNYYRIPASGK